MVLPSCVPRAFLADNLWLKIDKCNFGHGLELKSCVIHLIIRKYRKVCLFVVRQWLSCIFLNLSGLLYRATTSACNYVCCINMRVFSRSEIVAEVNALCCCSWVFYGCSEFPC